MISEIKNDVSLSRNNSSRPEFKRQSFEALEKTDLTERIEHRMFDLIVAYQAYTKEQPHFPKLSSNCIYELFPMMAQALVETEWVLGMETGPNRARLHFYYEEINKDGKTTNAYHAAAKGERGGDIMINIYYLLFIFSRFNNAWTLAEASSSLFKTFAHENFHHYAHHKYPEVDHKGREANNSGDFEEYSGNINEKGADLFATMYDESRKKRHQSFTKVRVPTQTLNQLQVA